MLRNSIRIAGVVTLTASGLLSAIAADEPSLKEQAAAALSKHRELSYMLPFRQPYLMPENSKKLGLTEEQLQTIRDIGALFNAKVLENPRTTMAEANTHAEKMEGEAKAKFLKEAWAKENKYQAERRQWAIDAKRQVEKLFTPQQLEMVREMEFAQRVPNLIYTPQAFHDLGLDADQQAKQKEILARIEKRRQELSQEMSKLYVIGSEDLVKQLTPEQRAKLRELLDKAHEQAIQVH